MPRRLIRSDSSCYVHNVAMLNSMHTYHAPVQNGVHSPEQSTPALIVKHQNDGGRGHLGRVVPPLALFLAKLGHRPVEGDLVRDELVESVDAL